MDQTEIKLDTPDDDGWEWAVVEIMGHRSHAGRTREVERFGIKLIRVDVPNKGDPVAHGWTSHFYPGSALFSALDPLLLALLKKVPPAGADWPAAQRVRWFRTFAINVSQIYDRDEDPVEMDIKIAEAAQ